MKIIFTILTFTISLHAFSQSVYKLDLEPVIGEDYFRYKIDNADLLNPGSDGIGQIWDLTNGNTSIQNNYRFFIKDPASTPHTVPGASFVIQNYPFVDTTFVGYEYFRDTVDGFYSLHEYGSILDIDYSSYEFIWKFPLNFNDSVISTFAYSSTAFSITYNYSVTSKLKFDGTGTLLAGPISIPNVLRFKYEQMSMRQAQQDTSYTTSYLWYLQGIHHPLADYTAILDPNGTTYYSANFYSNTNTTGVENISSDSDIKFYEDILNEHIEVNSMSGIENISLHDINGRQILNETVSNQKTYSLNTNLLLPGVYFLSVNSKRQFLAKKFIKR